MRYKFFLKWVLKTEWVMILIAILFSTITTSLTSFIFFDEDIVEELYGVTQITGRDTYVIDIFGMEGITKQTYIFMFFFFIIIYLVFILLWNQLAISSKKKDLILFYIKGYSPEDSNLKLFSVRLLVYLSVSVLGILLSLMFCVIFMLILQTDHMVLLPTVGYLMPFMINLMFFTIVDAIYLAKPVDKKQVIEYLRENY